MKNVSEDNKIIDNQKKLNEKQDKPKEKGEKKTKFNTNFLFTFMIFLNVAGILLMLSNIESVTNKVRGFNPNYEFPTISDFKITLYFLPVCIVRFNLNFF